MRILFVNKFLYPNGGSETYIFELGKELIRQGHEVQYFGMEHPNRILGNDIDAYTANMDFHRKNDSNSFSEKLTGYCNKILMPLKIIYSVEARKQIHKVLDDFRPDVVHLNNINFQITPSIIYEIRKWEKSANRRCKIVFTAHDYQWICPNHMLYNPQKGEVCERCQHSKYIECAKNNCIHGSKARSIIGALEAYYYKWRRTYSLVDTIICPSQFLYDRFSSDILLKDKLIVRHNFIVDTKNALSQESMDSLDQFEIELPDKYIVYFGRYDAQKGINTLIEVCKSLPTIDFVFAGRGPLEDEVNSVSNIKNVGFRTGDELRLLISKARLSIYPSEWYENCPFSVMESQAHGTPVLGSNIGGIPELINCGGQSITGQTYEAGNTIELKMKIELLWNDSTKLLEMSNNCNYNLFETINEYTDWLLNNIYAY